MLYSYNTMQGKGKGKSAPLPARRGPECSRKLRFPDIETTAQAGGRLSALRTGRLYPLVLISVRGWFDPRNIQCGVKKVNQSHYRTEVPRVFQEI